MHLNRVRMDFVVPIAVKLVPPQTHACKFVVFNPGSGWVGGGIKFGVNLQSLRSGGGGNEVDNHFEAQERLAAPVLTDEAKQSVLPPPAHLR
jgi:hypothetical protein